MTFKFHEKQLEAQQVLSGNATYNMLFGGSRSGKTLLLLRNVAMRALKAPGSRHLVVRFRFNHVKSSVVLDTFPKMMRLCFPEVKYELSKTDWYATLPNKSEIWFGGLDDKERSERVLGLEFCTIYLNECSQISYASFQLVVTRLAQKVNQVLDGKESIPLRPRIYLDCNPPSKAHWTFRLFKQRVDPETKEAVKNPENYASFQINPRDNVDNLGPEYLSTLAGLSARMRRRFEFGEFADATPNALFDESIIDKWRVEQAPDMVRIVVGVDPSGSGDTDNADNDEIGIAVAGLGYDGNAYVLEDCSLKAGPATWGGMGVSAYDRHKADVLVGEMNFGGDMVRQTIATAALKAGIRCNFKKVTASRGKTVRAEPFSALYEQGKIRHCGILPKLEDELCAMSTIGYTAQGSPNRADALIWALSELFPGMTTEKQKHVEMPIEEVCA